MKQFLIFTFFFLGVSSFSAHAQETITAVPGQDAILPCRAPRAKILSGVEWSRDDLETYYVLLYRDGQFLPDDQHPAFKGRVDLEHQRPKGQDISLILKNVSTADDGTYQCQVLTPERKRGKRAVETISTVHLSVVAAPPPPPPPGQEGGGASEEGGAAGLIVGVAAVAVLLGAAAGFLIYRKRRNQRRDSSQPFSVELQPLGHV